MEKTQRYDRGFYEILFRETLKMHRKSIGASARTRTKTFNNPVWIFPSQWERVYGKLIKTYQKNFTDFVLETLKEELPDWITQYKEGTRTDSTLISNLRKEENERIKIEKRLSTDSYPEDDEEIRRYLVKVLREDFKKDYSEEFRYDIYSDELRNFTNNLNTILTNIYDRGIDEVLADLSAIGENVSGFNQQQWQKQLSRLIGRQFTSNEAWLSEVLSLWTQENLNLIRGLSAEYIRRVTFIINDGVQNGLTQIEITNNVRQLNFSIEDARVRLIARDQIAALNGRITRLRQQGIGANMYIWSTEKDERVRTTHINLEGQICLWGDPKVYSEDGGITFIFRPPTMAIAEPGQEINCRCQGIPFFDRMLAEVDEEILQEAA